MICDKEDFFYDIHSLVKSFYPEDEVVVLTAEDEKAKEAYDDVLHLTIPPYTVRLEAKNELKRHIYRLLSEKEDRQLPWGTLSGIRPTKIPMRGIMQGQSRDEILADMKEKYLVSDRKALLAYEIAEREKRLMDRCGEGMSLYLGIPFCPTICSYCTFSSSPIGSWEKYLDDYLDTIEKELAASLCRITKPLHTLYIGGGTPTSLDEGRLARFLDMIDRYVDTGKVMEYTVEAGRPDTVTPEKLKIMKDHPITRISVNPQTMNGKTLTLIGRGHTPEQTEEAFAMARTAGFDNINMDLIMGLPGEREEEVAYTLEKIRAMAPDSLTVHSLALKRASRLTLGHEYDEDMLHNTDAIMEMAAEAAEGMGMVPYYLYRQKNMRGNLENVGYARPGAEGLYNILIMEEQENIMACGAGASTKVLQKDGHIVRVINPKNVSQYLTRIDELIEKKTASDIWEN
ncbi:MAG: coproporphyrinogen dehydrogenase HemZ [Lachnospiraceae bacterium]|nr:coproporphyrinogen dehydrogenase HemZ [Lachnospiraceae bacterium]